MIGFISIFFVSLIAILFAYKNPKASSIILFALFIRIFTLLLGEYFIDLPDSTRDSRSFEYGAWVIAEKGFYNQQWTLRNVEIHDTKLNRVSTKESHYLESDDFGEKPSYPVLWVTTTKGEAPYGETIEI